MDTFLNIVGRKINCNREYLPDEIGHVLEFRKRDKSYAAIWFKTKGCRYSFQGGCTMCDYFISTEVSEEDMYQFFLDGINELMEEPDLLVIQTSGSFFDEDEVPESVRLKIYQLLKSRLSKTILVFETHAYTITEAVIDQCLTYFEPERIQVEFGVESTNEWIRKYCINKWTTNKEIMDVIRILNRRKVAALINIVVGIPFLTLQEDIASASDSIMWALSQGVSSICLFPINLKPYTVVNWMNENDLYKQPSLWALVDVLSSIRQVFLPRLDTNWYRRTAKIDNPDYPSTILGPYTCDKCNDKVVLLLDRYNLDDAKRGIVIEELNSIECECRDRYRKSLKESDGRTLHERVAYSYEIIGTGLFGNNFWNDTTLKYLNVDEKV